MLETILLMLIGAVLFSAGATWGAWVAMRIESHQSPMPTLGGSGGGVAYDNDEESVDEEVAEESYQGSRL